MGDVTKFYVGDELYIANKTLSPPQSQALGAITSIVPALGSYAPSDPIPGAITIDGTAPLQQAYQASTDPANPLTYTTVYSFGANRHDYARVQQLDLVTQENPTAVHALVVDLAGVREVALAPWDQGGAVFEMTPADYQAALGAQDDLWTKAILNHYPNISAGVVSQLGDKASAWRLDALFAPVAVLREAPGPRQPGEDPWQYQQQVRYLIAQRNDLASNVEAAWINGAALRRTHLFEAKWIVSSDSWGIVDSDGSYFIYPDPLSPDFPNLPGGTYPLSEPLALDRD